MSKFSVMLRLLMNKVFFMYQRKYLAEWDKKLNYLLDNCKVREFDSHAVTFVDGNNKYRVWTNNRFYAFGYLYELNGVTQNLKYRPSWRTIMRLYFEIVEMKNLKAVIEYKEAIK
ncbi:hypothetical protein PSI23_16740 [Xenorhabdus sp. XENO-10]|uniref:Uncharacterized protein n=1 Tax=Xenorhabdus yunnanensis TaxID=3025878 RepID=A0ABT5LJZ5_9GAMM|nr:hypothetical protein [Xenorhabdus yunnanensis]MDC9590883.1 hypothetical protein [Xenorhabdus yunnanensis]